MSSTWFAATLPRFSLKPVDTGAVSGSSSPSLLLSSDSGVTLRPPGSPPAAAAARGSKAEPWASAPAAVATRACWSTVVSSSRRPSTLNIADGNGMTFMPPPARVAGSFDVLRWGAARSAARSAARQLRGGTPADTDIVNVYSRIAPARLCVCVLNKPMAPLRRKRRARKYNLGYNSPTRAPFAASLLSLESFPSQKSKKHLGG